jgi:hypothetical protein
MQVISTHRTSFGAASIARHSLVGKSSGGAWQIGDLHARSRCAFDACVGHRRRGREAQTGSPAGNEGMAQVEG